MYTIYTKKGDCHDVDFSATEVIGGVISFYKEGVLVFAINLDDFYFFKKVGIWSTSAVTISAPNVTLEGRVGADVHIGDDSKRCSYCGVVGCPLDK